MSRLNGLKFFMLVAPELSLSQLRPINQQYWADQLGSTQSTISKLLDDLVSEGFFVEGPPNGKSRQFHVNPTGLGVQQHYNRRM